MPEPGGIADVGAFVLRHRLGRASALGAILAASLRYRADANPVVLGRYSPLFAAWLGLLALLLLAALARSFLARRPATAPAAGAVLREIAWSCLGAAYLISALHDRTYGARALTLNLLGSPFPASALLEYTALCCLAAALIAWGARRARGRGQDLLLLAGTLSALALVGELAARAAAFIAPRTHGIPSHADAIFWRRYVRLNRSGFRDADHAPVATPGTRRLLLVGDSYAFGAGLRRTDDRFGEQLGAALSRRTGEAWEVINASELDRSTVEQFPFLEQGLTFDPDVVILLYVFNDADYLAGDLTAADTAARAGARRLPRRTALFDGPSSLVARLEPTRLLYWNSYLFQEFYVRWRLLRYGLTRQPTAGALSDVYHAPHLLRRHLDDLARFVRLAGSAGATVAIVPIDPGVASEATLRERYQLFVDAATGAGLPVWSILDVYRGRDLADITVSTLDSHPNALGYRLAVEAIAPRLAAAAGAR